MTERFILTARLKEEQVFWARKLAHRWDLSTLPADGQRPQGPRGAQALLAREVPEELRQRLARLTGGSPFLVYAAFLAAVKACLYRYTGNRSIAVGSPPCRVDGGAVGPNLVVVLDEVDDALSFRQFLLNVRASLTEAYSHQSYPFARLARELGMGEEDGSSGIGVVLALEGLHAELPPGLECDVGMTLSRAGEGIQMRLAYDPELFREETVDRFSRHLLNLLAAGLATSAAPIGGLEMLDLEERELVLVRWNDTAADFRRDTCVHELVAGQAARMPQAVAVTFGPDRLSYGELEERTNRLARYLRRRGAGPESLVGVSLERSLDLVVAVLGILKAGAAYVPLDPLYPLERLGYMMQQGRVSLLLTRSGLTGSLDPGVRAVPLDTEWPAIARESGAGIESAARPENLAYVLFTSGSTGRPKGVAMSHRSLCNLIAWQLRALPVPAARTLQFASLSFDVSFQEIFSTLASGGTLVLISEESRRDPDELLELMAREAVERLFVPFVALQQLAEAAGGSRFSARCRLREVITAGEQLQTTPSLIAFFRQQDGCSLLNQYGPTEAHVVSEHVVTGEPSGWPLLPPIGRPIANIRLYVLSSGLQPVPPGVPGEICIGGVGLARGYLHQPELTAVRFVPDPFAGDGGRMYRTGDLGRHRPDGAIEYLGRLDRQVKIRGHRIEPGEIEAVLAGHPALREAAVSVHEGVSGRQLVAYVVALEGARIEPAALGEFLRQRLPEPWIPSVFCQIDRLPLTPSGKVDRRALPPPGEFATGGGDEPLRTPTEEIVAAIWSGLLGRESLGSHDDFFDLGGHSLLATRVISRVREALKVDVPVRALFESPTVAAFAARLDAARRQGRAFQAPPMEAVSRDLDLPLSFAQERLWFLDRMAPGSTAYNLAAPLRLSGSLDVPALRRALSEVLRRHEVLRTTFRVVGGRPAQVIAPPAPVGMPLVDLSGLPELERERETRRLAADEARHVFDLARGPLLRFVLLRLARAEHAALLTLHHIVFDGWSAQLFTREMRALYQAFAAGRPSPLEDLPLQYADYAHWQRQWLTGAVLEQELDYWRNRLGGAPAVLDLPGDRPRPAVLRFRGESLHFAFPESLSRPLLALSRRAGCTPFMALLAGFQALLARHTHREDLCVGSPVAGRDHLATENLIGLFVNTLVLRADLSGEPGFEEILTRTRDIALEAQAHSEIPFEKLVEALQPERSLSYSPLVQVMVLFQDAAAEDREVPGLTIQPLEGEGGTAKFDLTLSIVRTGERLTGSLEYSVDLFDRVSILRLRDRLLTLLAGAVADPQCPFTRLPLLPEPERALLVEWNDVEAACPTTLCVHEQFERQMERTPHALAVAAGDVRLSYADLNRQANQVAHRLRSLGVGPELLVGICLERSPELVIAALGALKAGGAYLPLDPSHPAERLSLMLTDAGVAVLVTRQGIAARLQVAGIPVLCLEEDPSIARESGESPESGATSSHLAYVIYTSGSTGRPKGTEITHAALNNLVSWYHRVYGVDAGERSTLIVGPGFDLSIWEIWSFLTAGASLHIPRPETVASPERLVAWLAENAITSSFLATPLAQLALELPWPPHCALRALLTGGDRLQWWRPAGHPFRVINFYGPTECTVATTSASYSETDSSLLPPIGRPVDNARVYLLGPQLDLVPVGVPGELHVAGAGLARGYLRRPDLTAEKFIPNPFSADPGGRLYRTGDLARYLADGNLEFLGRIDHQVKIRGFRVELGEIESVLRECPGVLQVVVTAAEDTPGQRRLVAYIVADRESPPHPATLRESLRQRLPEHMVPAAFLFVESLPLTPNGKVDRLRLPALVPFPSPAERDVVAPRTLAELRLAQIWEEVLAVRPIGVRDSFFDLGGHSLLAASLMMRIGAAFERDLPLSFLFRNPTIELLAGALQEEDAGELPSDPLVPIQPAGERPPLVFVHPVGGNVFCYVELARQLGLEQPFYALQFTAPGSLEAMASGYVAALRRVQPRGPYYLGGWSIGGVVAFEMARQLVALGERVDLVALLDAYTPDGDTRPIKEGELLTRFVADLAASTGEPLFAGEADLGRMRETEVLQRTLEQGGFVPPGGGLEEVRSLFEAFKANFLAWRHYLPRFYSGELTLFQAEVPPERPRRDPAEPWRRLAGSVTVHRVPGDHYGMLRAPHIEELARRLAACLAAGQRSGDLVA